MEILDYPELDRDEFQELIQFVRDNLDIDRAFMMTELDKKIFYLRQKSKVFNIEIKEYIWGKDGTGSEDYRIQKQEYFGVALWNSNGYIDFYISNYSYRDLISLNHTWPNKLDDDVIILETKEIQQLSIIDALVANGYLIPDLKINKNPHYTGFRVTCPIYKIES